VSVLVIPVVVTFAILFIPLLSVAVITISTDFAFLFFIVCVTVGGVLSIFVTDKLATLVESDPWFVLSILLAYIVLFVSIVNAVVYFVQVLLS